MDKALLERKKNLQRTKNILTEIAGIGVLDLEEKNFFDVIDSEIFNSKICPDSKIDFRKDSAEIVNWIIDNTPFVTGDNTYLLINNYSVYVKIIDLKMLYRTLWDKEGAVIILSEDKHHLYEFGNDSRDEDNYVFDKYCV